MMKYDPLFYELQKLVSFVNNLVSFGFGGYKGVVVINEVSFTPRALEEIKTGSGGSAKREPRGLECQLVMTYCRGQAISSTRDSHFRRLEGGVICGRKSAVIRQPFNCGIS